MAAVYDDQKGKTSTNVPSDEELRRLTGINEDQESAYEREATNGAAADILAQEQDAAKGTSDAQHDLRSQTGLKGSGARDLAAQERAAQKQAKLAEKIPNTDLRDSSFGFRKEKPKGLSNLKSKAKSFAKKKWLIGGAAAGSLLLVVLIALLFMIGSLIIPNFAQNMVAYSFARVTRETVDSSTKITAEKVSLDAAPDGVYREAATQFGNEVDQTTGEKIWSTINKYRPEKVVENMRAEGQIYFEYGPAKTINPLSKLAGKQTLQKIYVNGQEIDVAQNSFSTLDKILNPVDYAKSLWKSNKLLKTTLADSMDTTLRGTNWLLRSRAASVIRDLYHLDLYRWDKKQLQQLDEENPYKADVTNEEEVYSDVTEGGAAAAEADAGLTGSEQQAATDANNTIEQCMQNNTCAESVVNQGGGIPQETANILGKDFASNFWKGALKYLAPTYAIAAPLCMIWQASIVNSAGVINANQGELERTAYTVTTAADQQKYGNVNGNAIGAQARQMGNNSQIANSNVMKRAEGIPVNTTQSGVDPQASAGGTYTYDVFSFLGPVDNVIRPVIGTVCAVFDNPYTGLLIGLATITIPAVKGAMSVAADGAAAVISKFVTELGSNLLGTLKTLIKPTELAKIAGITGATIAGSILAKIIALQHVGALNNGLSRGKTFDNQAEAGAILNANDIERQQNMGAPLTASGTAQTNAQNVAFLAKQEQQKSVFQRYFAITNANSFVSRLGIEAWAHLNLNIVPALLLSAGRIFNPVSAFSAVFSFMQNKSLAAAATTSDTADYNIVQWGWTPIEEWHYEYDPSYSILENQKILDQSGQEQTISNTYMKCFTEKIGTLLAAGDLRRDSNANIITNQGTCAPNNLSPLNRDDPNATDNMTFANPTAQLVFRWRVAIRDQNVLNQLLDTQNPSNGSNTPTTTTTTGGCGTGKYGALVSSGSSFAGVDQGIDFVPSGSKPYNICAPASGTITLADQTGHQFMRTTGQALVIEQLNQPPNAPSSSKYVYFAELVNIAPGIKPGVTVQKGQVIGTNSQSPGIEVGWGSGPQNGFMCGIGYPTPCGTSFNSWVQAQ